MLPSLQKGKGRKGNSSPNLALSLEVGLSLLPAEPHKAPHTTTAVVGEQLADRCLSVPTRLGKHLHKALPTPLPLRQLR